MGTPPVMPPSHWMPPPPVMGGPFGRHAVMWLVHFDKLDDNKTLSCKKLQNDGVYLFKFRCEKVSFAFARKFTFPTFNFYPFLRLFYKTRTIQEIVLLDTMMHIQERLGQKDQTDFRFFCFSSHLLHNIC